MTNFFRILGPPPASDDLEASPKKSAPVSLMSLNVEMPETSEEKSAPQTRDVKLPQGLEEVLAFKSKWATQQVRPQLLENSQLTLMEEWRG